MAYVYLLHCTGGSLYTGITTDIKRRLREHTSGNRAGAKYTRAHRPLGIAALWETDDLATAARIEYAIKQWPAARKRLLVETPWLLGSAPFPLPPGIRPPRAILPPGEEE